MAAVNVGLSLVRVHDSHYWNKVKANSRDGRVIVYGHAAYRYDADDRQDYEVLIRTSVTKDASAATE